ncbi:MAG: PAS sensor protein [Candidatus Amesbacteria bacterium GW2011_GWB1_47_19]|nr:MAG: PAS sensor protein [Candidatus Amesbacteria bacterium GW2011_GWA1_44_24]KKU31630.1 MAG: PAS sensor protein [Candidatus Amesbacteria bacterium GW2011_GWC1_46_24]KKU67403.1 MAG: PAS sensor protein [Candidatus Amesbacteria bacterium GW2011_GWB1_47_19]OGD05379.1 MAG: hypothetical protein A2379_05370 [Candidatus Amesbacteria bacterium RIFOXYB1_FULL_47_13]HBC72546.1 hypothetical protein [Candidatus Amesbacteria bacterium]
MKAKESEAAWIWVLIPLLLIQATVGLAVQVLGKWGLFMAGDEWRWILAGIYVLNSGMAILTLRSLRKERLQKMESIREQAKDEALLASIGEGIVVTDKNGLIEMINKAAELMIGWKGSEVLGKRWFEVVKLLDGRGNVVPPEKRATQRVLSGGGSVFSDRNYYVRRDNTKFAVATTAAPVTLEGKVVGVIAVFRDITREREIDKAKTEFVSLASHQLRTPLSAIKWFSEMLLAGDAGELVGEQKEFVHNMYQSNERMIELVNSLLNISRIESGRIRIDPVPTDLGELIKGVVLELTPKVTVKKLNLVLSIHPDLSKINLDPHLIRQVYLNLLSNSVKYTPEDGDVTVIVSRKDSDVVSQISDTGVGIPRGDYGRVFEKFYRGDNAQKMETDGTGLGLYLVKAIVESSGGKIRFESEENKGTTFWLSLPLTGMIPKKGEVTID